MPISEDPQSIDAKNCKPRLKGYPPIYSPQSGGSTDNPDEIAPAVNGRPKISIMKWDLRSDIKNLGATDPQTPVNALRAPSSPPLPDPAVWSSNLVRAIFDALGGRRDLAALRRWIDPTLYRRLAARVDTQPADSRTTPVVVRAVRLCQLDPHKAESAVVVEDQGRVRATAIRLEEFRGRWRVTALEIG